MILQKKTLAKVKSKMLKLTSVAVNDTATANPFPPVKIRF